jgi:hypothetical protein
MRHADVDQMLYRGTTGCRHGCLDRNEVNALELRCFGRIRVRCPDQMYERRVPRNRSRETPLVEGVANHRVRAGWKSLQRLGSHECMHDEASFQQSRNEGLAEVARPILRQSVGPICSNRSGGTRPPTSATTNR